jgi:predicted Zn-dependent protease
VQCLLREAFLFTLIGNIAFPQVSPEKETALGQRLAAQIDSKNQVITEGEVTGFLDRVLKRLSAGGALRLPLKLKVVDDSEPIASALPGGYLVLSSGAILGADNESELAGLLSHAMGHVQSGQALKQLAPPAIALVFIGGPWGSCWRNGFTPPGGLRARADILEAQADMLGLGYLVNAGYDPQALVIVFGRSKATFGPDEEVRVKALALAQATENKVLNTSAFDDIKSRLAPRLSLPRSPPTLNK